MEEPRPEELLSQSELELVSRMIRAVVDFPQYHINRIRITARPDGRFDYHVSQQGSKGAIFSTTPHTRNLRENLFALGFVTPDRSPESPKDAMTFTTKAKDWFEDARKDRNIITDDIVRAEIGRRAFARRSRPLDAATVLDFEEIGATLGVDPTRVAEQASILRELRYIRFGSSGPRDAGGGVSPAGEGDLLLAGERGLEWALADFESLRTYGRQAVNVSVGVGIYIEIQQFLTEIQDIDADPEQIEEAASLVQAFQNNPSIETLAPLMAFGANTLTFMVPIINLIVSNGDRIKQALAAAPLL